MKASKVLKRKLRFDHSVNKICDNSKLIENNDLFFCIKGKYHDGNDYIEDVISKYNVTIITNEIKAFNKYKNDKRINIIYSKNINKLLADSLKRFYHDISKQINIIGITGTNGKTTTTTLLYKYFICNNIKACLIGTNGIFINEKEISSNNTTPGIIKIYEVLEKCVKEDIKYVFMEVSSHGISLKRIYGISFKIKALTNITQDHLDYHKNFQNYQKTKLNWLKNSKKGTKVALNFDFGKFNFFKWRIIKQIFFYGQKNSHFLIENPHIMSNKSTFSIKIKNQSYYFETNLLALFNIYNVTLFISILYLLNKFDYYSINNFLKSKIQIDGRMMFYYYKNRYFIIDFAHTPDGIEKVLNFVKTIKENKIISICGCGGDRDNTKRSIMGKLLATNSDITIFTMDNPRSEKVEDIIEDMINFDDNPNNILKIPNRKDAIYKAYELSDEKDIIVILGRGNEINQIINNEMVHECDKEIVEDIING